MIRFFNASSHITLNILLLLVVATTSIAQTGRSHKMRIYKKQIGIYNERKLYAWFQYDSITTSFSCNVIFQYSDQLRTPSLKDTILLHFTNGEYIKLGNMSVESIEPIESFSNPGPDIQGDRKILFEIQYQTIIDSNAHTLFQTALLNQIQLISSPPNQPELWLRKYSITRKRNYEKALDQQLETLIYGNEKFTKSEQQMIQGFFHSR